MRPTAEQLRYAQIFLPYATDRQRKMRESGGRFVHYSGADAAMSMLKNKEVWMRKSSVMNDFSEIEYGLKCIDYAYLSPQGLRFRKVISEIYPDLLPKFESIYNSWRPVLRSDTYLTCLSEHDTAEDRLGRLSMWRAYGGVAGVAVVLNSTPFLTSSDALRAYSSPVAYLSPENFAVELDKVTDQIAAAREEVADLGSETCRGYLHHMFRLAALSTKHPGFHEEREWRIVYSPFRAPPSPLERSLESIRGIPQPIYKIKLQNYPGDAPLDASISSIVDRVIIGPCDFPHVVQETFIELLTQAGVGDAAARVVVSDIPLRRS